MAKYRPLTQEEKDWASNLKAVYERKKSETGLSQQKLGDVLGMSQSAVGQYLNGDIPLGLQAKVAFAIALRCNVADIDPNIPFSPPITTEEQQILDAYRRSGEKGKKLLLQVSEAAPLYNSKPKQGE